MAGRWTAFLDEAELVAPTLLWSEVGATLRQLEWRRELDRHLVEGALAWLARARITSVPSADLLHDARAVATCLGWPKTYDAEYVALALREHAPLVTLDARLRRAVSRLVRVISADRG